MPTMSTPGFLSSTIEYEAPAPSVTDSEFPHVADGPAAVTLASSSISRTLAWEVSPL